jgi:urease accessory protein
VEGSLTWEPQPTILVAGCDHRATTRIELASDATLVWRDEVVLGRHAECSGSLLQRLHVDRGGVPLLRTELPAGPRWPGAEGPAGTAGALVVSSLLVVGMPEPGLPDGADGAVMRLADDAWLVTALSGRRQLRADAGPDLATDVVHDLRQHDDELEQPPASASDHR